MPFRILSSVVNLIFLEGGWWSHTAWSISLLGPLGFRFPSSIVCIQLLHNRGRNRFLQHPTFKFWVPLRASASFCFMVLHTLNLSRVVSQLSTEFALFTPEGQEPCFVLHSPSIQLWGWWVAGVCCSTNTWFIKRITKGAGFSLWAFCFYYQCRYYTWSLYNRCLKFCMCQGLPHHYVFT